MEWIHPVPSSADSALCFDHALTGQTFSMAANDAVLGQFSSGASGMFLEVGVETFGPLGQDLPGMCLIHRPNINLSLFICRTASS